MPAAPAARLPRRAPPRAAAHQDLQLLLPLADDLVDVRHRRLAARPAAVAAAAAAPGSAAAALLVAAAAASPGTAVVAVGHPPPAPLRCSGLGVHVTLGRGRFQDVMRRRCRMVTSSSAAVGCTAHGPVEVLLGGAHAQRHRRELDHLGGAVADDVHAEHPAAVGGHHELHQHPLVAAGEHVAASAGRPRGRSRPARAPRASASVSPTAPTSGRVKTAVGISWWSGRTGRPPKTVSAKAWPSWIATGVSATPVGHVADRVDRRHRRSATSRRPRPRRSPRARRRAPPAPAPRCSGCARWRTAPGRRVCVSPLSSATASAAAGPLDRRHVALDLETMPRRAHRLGHVVAQVLVEAAQDLVAAVELGDVGAEPVHDRRRTRRRHSRRRRRASAPAAPRARTSRSR